MTNANLSDMLSQDVNNLFFAVKHQSEKNSSTIQNLKQVQIKDQT